MYANGNGPATPPALYFGKHKGRPLSEIDTGYLRWALATVKLSSGIRLAVEAELQARGAAVPPPRPRPRPGWQGPCSGCGFAVVDYRWHEFSNGTRQVRASCHRCGKWLGSAPRVPPYTAEADRNASATPTLDAVLLAEQEGVELVSDGRGIDLVPWSKASPRLRQLVRERQNLLASLLGSSDRRN